MSAKSVNVNVALTGLTIVSISLSVTRVTREESIVHRMAIFGFVAIDPSRGSRIDIVVSCVDVIVPVCVAPVSNLLILFDS